MSNSRMSFALFFSPLKSRGGGEGEGSTLSDGFTIPNFGNKTVYAWETTGV